MEVVDFLLDGLEAALELERELGAKIVELGPDGRKLLGASAKAPEAPPRGTLGEYAASPRSDFRSPSLARPIATTAPLVENQTETARVETKELVFLHDRPLSPKGVEMMAKILNALGKSDAPIVVTPPVPQAKITVVLGGLALKKYFTGMRGEPGQWQKTPEGRDVLITYSPEYILRFGTVTPAVQKIKEEMWRSLKAVKQRLVV